MADCCDPEDLQSVFTRRFARRTAKRYRNRGPSPAANRIVEFVTGHGVQGASVLAIGGGVGAIQVELLRRGASKVQRVEPADVVILHRVVCCYPDYPGLLSAAAQHAARLLVFSHPPDNRATRAVTWSENLAHRLRGNTFRGYIHPPAAMIAAAEAGGLHTTYQDHSWDWDVIGLVR